MSNIWITSDWHFCHSKDFIYKPRGFSSFEEMNAAIIERHNTVVQPEDEVYCLGDCMLENNEKGLECIKALNGKIHIIRGNHDSNTRAELYKSCNNVVEVCDGKYLKAGKQSFFLSHFPSITTNSDTDKPLSRRMINLCGHSHTSNKFLDFEKGLIYHCEVDAHNCTPINIENILNDIKTNIEVTCSNE